MRVFKSSYVVIYSILTFILFIGLSFGNANQPELKKDKTAHKNKNDEPKPQSMCPMTGGDINKEAFVDYKDKRVYLCCMGCKARFLMNPEKAIQKIYENGESVLVLDPVSVQPKCPVTSDDIDPALFVDHNEKRVYICSKKCQKKFSKKPEKYLQKMESSNKG